METKALRNYYQLRTEENEKITEMKKIVQDYNIVHNENLIVWFCNRFPLHQLDYFEEWVTRYLLGTEPFLSRMDEQSLEIFKIVFLGGQ